MELGFGLAAWILISTVETPTPIGTDLLQSLH